MSPLPSINLMVLAEAEAIHSIDSRLQFKAGDTLIALVPPSRLMEEKTDPRHPPSRLSEDTFHGGMI